MSSPAHQSYIEHILKLTMATLVHASCSTVDGPTTRNNQDMTLRVVGMSAIPFPSGLALGRRLSRDNSLEIEGSADILSLNSYGALYMKHFWNSNIYSNFGFSASRSIMQNLQPYRTGMHVSWGTETYFGPTLFGGAEYVNLDLAPFQSEGKWKVGGGVNVYRLYLGWGW